MTTNPTAKEANDAYNAGYRAGLHNEKHKEEYHLSPKHYEMGYDDGRSDRQDKFHYSVNPIGLGFSSPRRPKRTNSNKRMDTTQARKQGFIDGSNYEPNNYESYSGMSRTAYKVGYEEGKNSRIRKNSMDRLNNIVNNPYDKKLAAKIYLQGLNLGIKGKPKVGGNWGEYREMYDKGYDDGKNAAVTSKKKNSTVRINPKHRYSVDEVASGKGWYAVKDLDGYSLNYNGPNGWEYNYRTYDTLEDIYKNWGYPTKKNSTVRINPSDMYTRGYRDATDNLVKDNSLRDDADYLKGYHDAYDYRIMTGKGIKARHIPNPPKVQHKSSYMGPKNRYFPKVKPGRPAGGPKGGYWWSLDLYDNNNKLVSHKVGNGTKEKAIADAKSFVGLKVKHKIIQRSELHGPYKKPPSKKDSR